MWDFVVLNYFPKTPLICDLKQFSKSRLKFAELVDCKGSSALWAIVAKFYVLCAMCKSWMHYGSLQWIWLSTVDYCAEWSHTIKIFDDFPVMGHHAGFRSALRAIAQDLVMRCELLCRIAYVLWAIAPTKYQRAELNCLSLCLDCCMEILVSSIPLVYNGNRFLRFLY